ATRHVTVVTLITERLAARIHSVDGRTGLARSLNRELPTAILAGNGIGRTVQAGRANSPIDRRSKGFELNDADAFARKIRQTFAAAGLLHPAHFHEEAQTLAVIGPFRALRIDNRVETQT